jgi:uncharacterized protein (TIGR02246 family)
VTETEELTMTVALLSSRWARVLTAIACAIGLLQACTVPVRETEDVADDIRAWVTSYETAWNTHDAAAVADFFSADADFIVGNGPRIVGRDAVEEAWQGYFAGIDDARKGTFAIASLEAIGPDVIFLNINSTTAGPADSGDELPTRLARGTWVVTQYNGNWQISVFRALPAEGDIRSGPGRDLEHWIRSGFEFSWENGQPMRDEVRQVWSQLGRGGKGYGFRTFNARQDTANSNVDQTAQPLLGSMEYWRVTLDELRTSVVGDIGLTWGVYTEEFKRKEEPPETVRVRFTNTLRWNGQGWENLLYHRDAQVFGVNGEYLEQE